MKSTFISIIVLFFSITSQAQFENCKYLEEGQKPAKAELAEMNWLEGYWVGEGFGGIIEEIWTNKMGGAMMGSFRMVVDGEVSFYELMTISQEDETLLLRIKHFDKNLKGWEEKDQSIEIKLVEIKPDIAYFEGLTFEKVSDNQLNIFVVFDESEDQKNEGKFSYKRKERNF
jgi:hypothetical protein